MAGDGAMSGALGSTKRPKPEKGSKRKRKEKRAMESKSHNPAAEESKMEVREGSSSSNKRRKKKLVTWRLSQDLIDYMLSPEYIGFMVTEPPRRLLPRIPEEMFHRNLRKRIAAQAKDKDNVEFDAYALYEWRTKGYVEMQEEITDDEEEEP